MSKQQPRTMGRGVWQAILFALPVLVTAQRGEEYFINGVYNPVIADVQKVDLRPVPIDTVLAPKSIAYTLLPVRGEVPVRVDSIEAAKLNIRAAQEKLYKGFVKAGFGLYTTPLVEAYFDQTRSRTNGYGVHFKHMSSNGGLSDTGPSDYSINGLDGYYTAYLRKHEVGARFMYDRRRVSHYGYPATDSLENLINAISVPEAYRKQVYNGIGFAARIRSLHKDSTKLAHDVELTANNLTTMAGGSELNVRIAAELGMRQGSETYGGRILIDNNAFRGKLATGPDLRQNGTLVGLTPHVRTATDKYEVRVGAGIYVDAMGKTTFHFYPQAYAHYRLFDDILVPYVGVDGERRRNSLRSLSRENPWVVETPTLMNSSLMYDLHGGVRGSFSKDLGFDVRLSKSRVGDMALFVNEPMAYLGVLQGDRFQVAYDRVDRFTIGGLMRYHHQERIDVHGGLRLHSYSTHVETEAWNLPAYELELGAVYDFQDKLLLKVDALFMGRRKAVTRTSTTQTDGSVLHVDTPTDLEGFLDLHVGLEYRYTKRLSVFLDASNLSASKYERWSRYPVQRGLVLVGATMSF